MLETKGNEVNGVFDRIFCRDYASRLDFATLQFRDDLFRVSALLASLKGQGGAGRQEGKMTGLRTASHDSRKCARRKSFGRGRIADAFARSQARFAGAGARTTARPADPSVAGLRGRVQE